MDSRNCKNNTTEPVSLANQIERMGRALTANELADLLTVSKITILKKAKSGRIPSFHIGANVRFDPRSVARWLRRMGVKLNRKVKGVESVATLNTLGGGLTRTASIRNASKPWPGFRPALQESKSAPERLTARPMPI